MARELIRARPGVYGRQATPEEAERLRAFAKQYVEDAPKRSAEDRKSLKRGMEKLKRQFPELFKGKNDGK
jgi:NADPH-dependent curcumin reductase CurA